MKIHLNSELTETEINDYAPDEIIVATGSIPNRRDFNGTTEPTADDVLLGKVAAGNAFAL